MQKETPNALRKHDNFEIIFFELDNDSCPVQDFLDSLNDKMAAKVYGMMDVLAEFETSYENLIQKNWKMKYMNYVPKQALIFTGYYFSFVQEKKT